VPLLPSPAAYTYNGHRGLRVEAETGRLRVRWNGVLSENTPDVFSREYDFEGYRVWMGRDERDVSFSLISSYDVEDYNRYDYDETSGTFKLNESPFSLEELRCLYATCGDTTWHPLDYPRYRPLVVEIPGVAIQTYYFEPQDFNRSILGNDSVNATTKIRKAYPKAPKPSILNPDSIRAHFPNGQDSAYLTEEGFIKYYEYELVIDSLLPTVPYWINVTAFDYGAPSSGLASLETSRTLLPLVAYPLPSVDRIAAENMEAYVYPNPYRLDGNYRSEGYEGRAQADRDVDRTRRINFANLPPKCTIRIYSLDGDFVREIVHDFDPDDPLANHDTWDLITRNFQQAVSGLYYWTVEDDNGHTQIGKLVIIF
jgi:hypothetical protein